MAKRHPIILAIANPLFSFFLKASIPSTIDIKANGIKYNFMWIRVSSVIPNNARVLPLEER